MTPRPPHPALLSQRGRRCVLSALLAAGGWLWFAQIQSVARADSPPMFRILVHPDNPVSRVSREFVTQAFLKRTTRWPDGEIIHPADQRVNSDVRRRFSDALLKRSVAAVKRYWQQRIFSGRDLPPPELEGDEAVVSYVLKHRGALGYVSATAKLDHAKPIQVQ